MFLGQFANEGVELRRDTETPQVQATLYRQAVGLLIFLTCTRPDILFTINLASCYMQSPHMLHLQVVHGIMRYLRSYPN